MSTNDLELLELAARAAGVEHYGFGLMMNDEPFLKIKTHLGMWAPLTDDGDALRLAVNLSFDVDIEYDGCVIHAPDLEGWISEIAKEGDVLAATRRAIVRAAAEIGRSMP